MGGIVGLFNLDGRPAALHDLQRLAAAATRPAEGGAHFWTASSMGLGHRHGWADNDAQPFTTPHGIAVSFEGRLDNRDELPAPVPVLSHIPSDAAYVAAVHDQRGDEFASHLSGDFAVALCDPGRHRMVLARDPMGARPLYYTQVDRRLLFGTEIKSLLAFPGVTRAPDDDALADLVLDRWIDPHRTCFRDIYAVPPGHALHATPDRVTVRRHQDFDPGRELRYRHIDEYVDAFRAVFRQSVQRRIRSPRPVAVSVSGGVDSSSIFCEAVAIARQDSAHQGIRGISMTFPAGSPADEREFIDSLDAVSPHPVERMPVSEIRVLRDATRIIAHLERPELVWSTFPEVLGRARRAGCSVILDGYYGDEALFPRRYLVDLAYRGSWLKIRRDLREFGVWMNDDSHDWKVEFWNSLGRSALPRPVFDAMKRGASRRRAARYPAWYASAFVERLLDRQMSRFESPHRFASAHAQECFRNATAGHYLYHVQRLSAVAAAHGMELASPFRDRDLIAFLMAIPGDVINRHGVPKGLFREAMLGLLPEPIRTRRWKADFTFMFKRGALADYNCIGRLLTPDSMAVAAGFVNGTGIEESIARYRSVVAQDDDMAIPAWRVTTLAALELWLRHFFGA